VRFEGPYGEYENYGLGCVVWQTGNTVSEKPAAAYIFKEEENILI
jgi:hypothetical protein